MKKILVALDGSANSDKALQLAVELAEKYGSNLVALNVVSSPPRVQALIGPLEERGREVLNKATEYATSHSVNVEKRQYHGDPATSIIEMIEKEGITLVVMGKRGLSPIKSFLIGSVSGRVVQNAQCPVLVVT